VKQQGREAEEEKEEEEEEEEEQAAEGKCLETRGSEKTQTVSRT